MPGKAELSLGKTIMTQNRSTQTFVGQTALFFTAVLIIGMASVSIGYAAPFTINSTADAVDATPGDGVCATSVATCTLRAAIQEANALPGADAISIPAGTYVLGIAGTGEDAAATGDLDITDDLSIIGAGVADTIIDAGKVDRLFDIFGPATVTITNATARNGDLGVGGSGGGIQNAGILALDDLILTGNTAGINFGSGGGIFNAGTLNLTNVTVSANSAFFTGGLANLGDATLVNVTVSSNTAVDATAGLDNNVGGSVALVNVTISGNTGGGFTTSGGGIGNYGTATLTNVTISGNTGGGSGGIFIPFAGPFSPSTQLKNTIVANNFGGAFVGNCSATASPIVSLGHNLDSDNTCGLTGPGDLVNTAPLLGPLQDNGGPTSTHALLDGSPAIDAGSPDCPPPTTDQRGITRPQGTTCDIGAYEFSHTTAIPTLSEWAQIVMAGLLVGGGLLALRRRTGS